MYIQYIQRKDNASTRATVTVTDRHTTAAPLTEAIAPLIVIMPDRSILMKLVGTSALRMTAGQKGNTYVDQSSDRTSCSPMSVTNFT